MKYLYAVQQLGRFITITVFTVAACFSWAVDKPLNPSEAKLAVEAHQILVAHCGKCHGKGGSYSDDMLLNYDQLIEEAFIVKGKSGESDLYGVIADGSMPPKKAKNPVAAKDAEVIKRWIDEGAPDWNLAPQQKREFVTMESVIGSIVSDLKKIPNRDRQYVRYYTLTHLYNAGESDDALANYRIALSKLVNSLSWERAIVNPVAIDGYKTVLRLDMRDYGWDKAIWKRITELYPYAINYPYKSYEELCSLATAEVPFLRVDWFISTAALPPLYHDILGIPDTDFELEKMLNVNVKRNLRDSPGRRVWRSGFLKSGVSKFNRIVERHTSPYGSYWKSYDFDSNKGRKNIFQNPVLFEHAGGEMIFNLPNGLQGYLLAESNGKRIDEAPINIVFSTQGSDPIIRNGLSCMACHTAGMKEFKDRAGELHLAIEATDFGNPDEKEYALALYPDADTMNRLVQQDIDVFERAVSQLGGVIGGREPIALLTDKYEDALDAKLTAAEIGMGKDDFVQKLRNHELLKSTGLNTLAVGGTIARETWEELFPLVVTSLGAGDPRFNKDQFKRFNDSLSSDDRRKWIEDTLKGGAGNNDSSRMTIPVEEFLKLRKQLDDYQSKQAASLAEQQELPKAPINGKQNMEIGGLAAADAELIAKGKELFQAKICTTCHQVPGGPPALAGMAMKAPKFEGNFWGQEREVTLGFGGKDAKAKFNEAYFIESIRNPNAKVVKSAAAPMPPPPAVNDEEMKALVAYVKSLSDGTTQTAAQQLRDEIVDRPFNAIMMVNLYSQNHVKFQATAARTAEKFERESNAILIEVMEYDPATRKSSPYIHAITHVRETPFEIKPDAKAWDESAASLSSASSGVQALHHLRFLKSDPRIVIAPVGPPDSVQVKALGVKPYKLAAKPFKFSKAFIMKHDGRSFGEVIFKMDLRNREYVKFDKSLVRAITKGFSPSEGDLVFSQTGELLGIMANNEYCHVITSVVPREAILFGQHSDRERFTMINLINLMYEMPLGLR